MSGSQQHQTNTSPPNIIALPSIQDNLYSQPAEEALIGAVIIDPQAYIKVANKIKPADFFLLRHGYIWSAIERINANGNPIDIVTIEGQLSADKTLDSIGGRAYVTQLIAQTPSSVHVDVYAGMVQRLSMIRSLMAASDQFKGVALDPDKNLNEKIQMMYAEIQRIAAPLAEEQIENIAVSINAHMDAVEQAYENKSAEPMMGVPSGIRSIDTMLNGFHKRKVYVIAGRKHMGKTGLLMSIAMGAAKAGARIAIFNVADGSKRDVVNNLISMETGIEPYRLELGDMDKFEYERYVEACGRLARLGIFIRSKKGMSPREIAFEAAALKSEHGLDMVIIDYLQRLSAGEHLPPAVQNNNYMAMSHVSQALTKMSSDEGPLTNGYLNVPILVGAQINRGGARRKDNRPTSDDIKGCGNIEEDADCVMIVHRPGYYDRNCDNPDITEVIVEKNKITRQLGLIECKTSQATARFYDVDTPF